MGTLEKKILGAVVLVIVTGSVFAVTMVYFMQKKSIYETAQEKMFETANVISKSLKRTMLEGKSNITRAMSNDFKTLKGIENITILNHEGREAFNKTAPSKESEIVKRFAADLSPFSIIKNNRMLI